jgi:hypothetical protein
MSDSSSILEPADTSPATERPTGVVVSVILVAAVGLMMAWSQRTVVAGRGTADDHALALCLVIAGVSGVIGGIGVWKRASWATSALLVWIAGTVVAILLEDTIDVGTLMPILFMCGPQALVVWYLVTWMRGDVAETNLSSHSRSRDALGTPVLLAAGVFAPPVIVAAGFLISAAMLGSPGSLVLIVLPVALLGFVVALSRRAATRGVAVAFSVVAMTTSALALLLLTLGSMAK